MKISANKYSPYYRKNVFDYSVFVDGKNISYAYFADDENNFVEKYKTDSNGNIVTKINGEPLSEKVEGDVEIRYMPNEI